MGEFFNLTIETAPMLADIDMVEKRLVETFKLKNKVEIEANKTIRRIIGGMQMAWGLIQGAVRAAGGSISMTTRLVVSAGLGAAQALAPLLATLQIFGAATLDPAKIAASLAGFAALATAITALVAFQGQEKQMSLQLRGMNMAMNSVGNMLYAWL